MAKFNPKKWMAKKGPKRNRWQKRQQKGIGGGEGVRPHKQGLLAAEDIVALNTSATSLSPFQFSNLTFLENILH